MVTDAEKLELQRLREVTAEACALLNINSPRLIVPAISELKDSANAVLAAWDKKTGLLTSHYATAGKKIVERLRVAAKT